MEPMPSAMRHTLTLMHWVMQGLAGADRARRQRLAGGPATLTGADAMAMYLKDAGIDVPRIETAIKSLLQDGQAATAIKDVVTTVADAAASPKDLGTLVQRFAQCCGPTQAPAAAPAGTAWTATWEPGKPPRFRPDLTSAARHAQPPTATSPAPVAPKTPPPQFRPDLTSAARHAQPPATDPSTSAPPAANDTRPTVTCPPPGLLDAIANTSACTDPIPEPPKFDDPAMAQRIEALERRMDAFEAGIGRELAALKERVLAKFQELSERIAANAAKQSRMQAELDLLRARVQALEVHASPAPGAETSTAEEAVASEPQAENASTGTTTTDVEAPPTDSQPADEPEVREASQGPADSAQDNADTPATQVDASSRGEGSDAADADHTDLSDHRNAAAALEQDRLLALKSARVEAQPEDAAAADSAVEANDQHRRLSVIEGRMGQMEDSAQSALSALSTVADALDGLSSRMEEEGQ
jgi:hypothetical protein